MTVTYLGTVTINDGESVVFDIPADADPAQARREHAEAERKRLAEIADIGRVQNTRRARAARRFKRALQMFARTSWR